MKTKVPANSLAQRIKRISELKEALEALLSSSIIAQMGKLRPTGDMLITVTWLVSSGQNKNTGVLASRKMLYPDR